jgi:uncharacterized phage protein (TIGR01671 family)
MREIKFRAWSKISHEMFTVIMLAFPFGENRVIVSGRGGSTDTGDDDCVLMQLTGVKDTNGKEIYEGDVVKTDVGLCEIEWTGCGLTLHTLPRETSRSIFSIAHHGREVIGNIYENPELLHEATKC